MKKLSYAVIAGLLLLVSGCSDDSGRTIGKNNNGQYDKGTPMCDKGAYGEVNGLCN